MGKRVKQKKQIDSFTNADDLQEDQKKSSKTKFNQQEANKRNRSIQKEMVRKIKNILDTNPTAEETKHTNKVIYTIKPVE